MAKGKSSKIDRPALQTLDELTGELGIKITEFQTALDTSFTWIGLGRKAADVHELCKAIEKKLPKRSRTPATSLCRHAFFMKKFAHEKNRDVIDDDFRSLKTSYKDVKEEISRLNEKLERGPEATTDGKLDCEGIKAMCISRTKDLQGQVDDCLVGLPYQSKISTSIVIAADDYFQEIFPPGSKEFARYHGFRANWGNPDPSGRKEWLENLHAELSNALHKFETTPAGLFPSLKYGIPENRLSAAASVSHGLGIQATGTPFSKRLVEFCRRIDTCNYNNCEDALAFYLRKILESSIVRRYEEDKRKSEIVANNQVFHLEDLIKTASKNSGGYLHPDVVNKLLNHKLLKLMMDESVHDWAYDPSGDDIRSMISTVKLALAQLKVNNL